MFLALTRFQATNSVFSIFDENNSFSTTTPGHCTPKNSEEGIDKLKKLERRFQNDIELNVKELEKTDLSIVKEFFCLTLILLKKKYLKK